MLSLKTKIYILAKIYGVTEEEINEEFITNEFLLIDDWDEFEDLDNEEFYDQIIVDEDDRDSFVSIMFEHNYLEFIDFIGGFQELDESSEDYFLEMVQDFLISLFTGEKGEIEPIIPTKKEVLINKIKYHFGVKIEYPLKSIFLKIFGGLLKRYYEIEEIPFCIETTPLKYWKEELNYEYLIEHEEELEDI